MSQKNRTLLVLILLLVTGCTFSPESGVAGSPTPAQLPADTAAPTTSPSPTPSPTPTPQVRLSTGDRALFLGDFDRAQYEYQSAFESAVDPAYRAAALWGIGRVYREAGNNARSLEILFQLCSEYPDASQTPGAYYLRGMIYAEQERYLEAADAFQQYVALRPGTLDTYAQTARGDALFNAGLYTDAIAAYQAALSADHIGDDTRVQIDIAQAYELTGDTVTALGMYDSIAATSGQDYVKAEMDLLAGQLHLGLGQADPAYQRFLHAVENYPSSYDSYSALVALVNAGIPVSDLDRGLVDYFAGQYGYALDAFNRYLDSGAPNDGTANYYAAMTLREMGQYQQAVEAFTGYISSYPANQYWPAAWDEKAYTQWYFLGNYDAAIETLLAFTRQAQVAGTIPQTMLTIGRLYERNGQLEQAARMWEDLNDAYPGSEVATQALFWAGITRFRMGQYDQALITFQRSILLSTTPTDQARAYFWSGKTQQVLGDAAVAQESWRLAAALDATDYYSLRARDKLFNRGLFEAVPQLDTQVDLETERRDTEAWLRVTFNLPSDTALSGIGTLASDPRFVRGSELWQYGLADEARAEFEALRLAVSNDPAESFRLGNALIELGLYRPGITALRQVLFLAGMNTQLQTLAAPAYFNHMRYGFYYPELVPAAASQGGLEPLYLYSVIRQESLYEGFATSYAGARGLMQIMPATGQDLADSLGWPAGYTDSDLFRPLINVNLGTTYLVTNRGRLNGDLVATLAAYHAGPGSAEIWLGLSGDDPDLFVELVRFEDTRNYIRSIYEIYWMYRLNYEKTP